MQRTTIGAIALTGIITITGVWQLLHRGSTTPETPKATVTMNSSVVAVSAPTTKPHSVVGAIADSNSKGGAVRAAIRFLELDERLFPAVSPEGSRALSDSITSKGSRKRLGDRAEEHQREILAKGDLGGLTLRLAPISTRVRKYGDTSVTVDIFLLRLWSFPTKGALDDYATAELKLVWENNEWRLNDSAVIDGPYPVARFSARPTLASTAAQYEQTLAGFDDEDLLP
jgi:hypothetical protein